MPNKGTNPLKEIKKMEIKRNGSQPSAKGPTDWFTGTVRIDALFQAPDPALVQGASVTFEPGARTAWHTHPLGSDQVIRLSVTRELVHVDSPPLPPRSVQPSRRWQNAR